MRYYALLAAAVCLYLAVLGSCDCTSHRRSLTLVGGAPTGVTGTGADDPAVTAAVAALMTNRAYDPDTHMIYGCAKSNRSRIHDGAVTTFIYDPENYNQQAVESLGTGLGADHYYTVDMDLAEGPHLTMKFIYNVGQGLLFEVDGERDPITSGTTAPADCTLRGNLAGKAIDLTFQQELHGAAGASLHGYY